MLCNVVLLLKSKGIKWSYVPRLHCLATFSQQSLVNGAMEGKPSFDNEDKNNEDNNNEDNNNKDNINKDNDTKDNDTNDNDNNNEDNKA